MVQADTPPSLPTPRRSGFTLQKRQARLAWFMLVPALAVVLVVAVYPLGQTIYDSFTDQQFLAGITPTKWVGLQNYHDVIFDDPDFRNAIWETLKLSFFSVVIEFVLGMIIALVVTSNFKGRGALRTAMLIPWAIPTVVSAQMWKWMLDDVFGVVNDALAR